MRLVIASNNKGKVREYKEMLSPLGYEVVSLKEAGITLDVEETGKTFEENAQLKASAAAELLPDCAVIADDSGLEVEALNGAPGIYSARYGGADLDDKGRTKLLLENMKDVPDDKRNARFVCVIAFVSPEGKSFTVRGECDGTIGRIPLGNNGFGYDPVFVCQGKTFAQHDENFKNSVSHRAKALEKLVLQLSE